MEPVSQASTLFKMAFLGFSLLTGGPPMELAQVAALAAVQGSEAPAEIVAGEAPLVTPPAPGPAPAQDASRTLRGIPAWSAIVGNTIAGKSDDEDLYEFYAKNGTAKQLIGADKDSGKWTLKGEVICLDYKNADGEVCYTITVNGNEATFTDEDDNESTYQILPGNPKKL